MNEEIIWKDISGYEGKYQVSNTGLIMNLGYEYIDKLGRKYFQPPLILKPVIGSQGYQSVFFFKKQLRVHRIVAEAFIPNPTNLPFVNHIDGIKCNNNVSNLEWCDALHNMRHAHEHGLIPKRPLKGVENPCAKLNEAQVVRARELRKKGLTLDEICKIFDISIGVCSRLINHNSYKDVS